MRPLDDLDRRLLFELRNDGRATISALAATLHVSRGTAQARLERFYADFGFTSVGNTYLEDGIAHQEMLRPA